MTLFEAPVEHTLTSREMEFLQCFEKTIREHMEPTNRGQHSESVMLALLKNARIVRRQAKEDNRVDLAGYAACGGEIEGGNG